ncbi:MAG: PSD1 domain-containing protein [Pirellulaceae bacterium]|nr:PSD1 domain-containing protein [Pirellulaceae bacterium]
MLNNDAKFAYLAFVFTLGFAASSTLVADDGRMAERAAQFEREIRPVFVGQCLKCHGATKQEGGLRLDTRDGLMKGGDSGPALVPGKPEESLLLDALNHNGLEMPPTSKLPPKTILHFERWIAGGAVWPDSVASLRESEGNITDADRAWWAFVPLNKAAPPVDARDSWSQNEIDRFVWKALADKQMQPAPRADKTTLIRRLYLDVIGLPPSPSVIDAFVKDNSPTAFEQVVDQLLNDPRYGEHWARFWLDLVRYSESDGWNQDAYRPHLWRYRDYIVNAFNSDLSYQQFVMDQLAGDSTAESNPQGLIAAGFMRLGVYEYNQRDARGQWNDIMNEMADVAGDVFLGMSVACARCHQHKFDPIPQKDYFKLRAFFEPVCYRDDLVAATAEEKKQYQEQLAVWEKATEPIQRQIAELLEPYEKKKWKSTVDKFPLDIQACFHMPSHERTSWQEQMAYLVSRQYMDEGGGPLKGMKKEDTEKHDALLKELEAFADLKPKPLPAAMTVVEFPGLISPTYNPDDPKRQSIAPGFLEVLSEGHGLPSLDELSSTANSASEPAATPASRRAALARWITDARNPLTTRVIVNRIWQQHFGQGLVATSNDFGHLGDTPTHPELLDWLTATFIDGGWQFKQLHKRILMSATWQQSARHPEASRYQGLDPSERLLWRSRVRRLSAEQIRDAMLAASGELAPEVGGPSVTEDKPRRSLYLKSFRNQNDTFLHGFDVANGLQSVAVRDSTTTPTQSLLLLNGKYAMGRSEKLAQRLLAEHAEPEPTLRNAFRWTWGTEPSPSEFDQARQYVGLHPGEDGQYIDPKKFSDFCHVLFNSNQFLYLE